MQQYDPFGLWMHARREFEKAMDRQLHTEAIKAIRLNEALPKITLSKSQIGKAKAYVRQVGRIIRIPV